QSFAPEFGYQHTFSIPSSSEANVNQERLPAAARTHLLFNEQAIFTELNRKINTIYTIEMIFVGTDDTITEESLAKETTPLFIKRKNGTIEFITLRTKLVLREGDLLGVL